MAKVKTIFDFTDKIIDVCIFNLTKEEK